MNINLIVTKLLSNGFTQKSLAEKLTAAGYKTNPSTIHRMKANKSYQTGSDKAIFLYDLYLKAIKAKSRGNKNPPERGELNAEETQGATSGSSNNA